MLRNLSTFLLALLCASQIVVATAPAAPVAATGARKDETAKTIGQLVRLSESDLAELLEAGDEPMTQGISTATNEATPVDESPLQRWLIDMAIKVRDGLQGTLTPKRDWFALIRRTHDWFSRYKRIYDKRSASGANKLLAPVDVLAVEFARSDSELYGQKKASGQTRAAHSDQILEQKSIETTDYLYDALDKLMCRLEAIDLNDPRAIEQHLAADTVLTSQELRATREFSEAMERVKRIGLNTAEGVFKNEVMVVVRIAIVNVLAAQIGHMASANPTGSMSHLATLLLGAHGPSLPVEYLADVNKRTLITLVGALNPVARINESLHRAPNKAAAQPAQSMLDSNWVD